MTNENTSNEIKDYEYEDFSCPKRPKMTSKVWEEMERILTTAGSKVMCKHCGKFLQDNCGTSHLKRHLIICSKRPPTSVTTQDSMKGSGLNNVLIVRPLKVEPESQVTCFSQTPFFRASTVDASIENTSSLKRELNQKMSSPLLLPSVESSKNQGETSLDDVEMKAFYASLDTETSSMSPVSPPEDTTITAELSNTTSCGETKKALKTLQDLLAKDFSILLNTEQCGIIKSTIQYLSKLCASDGISAEMKLLILKVSREFDRQCCDYKDANRKVESAKSNILKADKLEEDLEVNKNEFKEVLCLENELNNQIATLEQRKKDLEEQINAIKTDLSVFQSAKITATKRKREGFEKAKSLKAQRDELREQMPHLKDEMEMAKKIQENIRAEWSKLGEKFNKSLDGVNIEYLDGKSSI